MLCVVAAVIERDGRILIGQRPPGKTHPLEWEFPGGKVEPGEPLRQALARELREELAIKAEIGKQIDRYLFEYAQQKPIELIFFRVTEFTGEPVNLAFQEIRWVKQTELVSYPFLEGDKRFVLQLEAGL